MNTGVCVCGQPSSGFLGMSLEWNCSLGYMKSECPMLSSQTSKSAELDCLRIQLRADSVLITSAFSTFSSTWTCFWCLNTPLPLVWTLPSPLLFLLIILLIPQFSACCFLLRASPTPAFVDGSVSSLSPLSYFLVLSFCNFTCLNDSCLCSSLESNNGRAVVLGCAVLFLST